MKTRLIKVIFTVPFLCVDALVIPIALVYWIASGNYLDPLTFQLWETDNEK